MICSYIDVYFIYVVIFYRYIEDVDIVSNTSKTEAIYLYSSICGEYIVEGEKKPLLRRLPATSGENNLMLCHYSWSHKYSSSLV
jgi:hypothetical protein